MTIVMINPVPLPGCPKEDLTTQFSINFEGGPQYIVGIGKGAAKNGTPYPISVQEVVVKAAPTKDWVIIEAKGSTFNIWSHNEGSVTVSPSTDQESGNLDSLTTRKVTAGAMTATAGLS